ncbi:phosphatidylserine/phosphatidylglycerophosphate/cardiolipin synthase family protein [Aquabacterium sp.]|uniref:phospholipase D-like domain-containing protein n=1 Tax=Aquabacterium sp. TaxID=1872578 RepID=UPI003784CF00
MPLHRLHLLLLIAVLALAGCAGLPPRGTPAPSQAFTDTGQTALARIAEASRPPGETAPSGFRVLPAGEYALNARLALAQRAQRSLDLQYYHLHNDHAGRLLLRALRDAAARGVRVRLLLDDFYAAEVDELLLGLAAHDNVEVRLFNPLPLRRGPPVLRLLLSPGDFERHNHRMHNKLFVADNAMTLYGGRNIGDEYFMSARDANFVDFDVLSTGQVVQDMSAVFDRYWNSDVVWPLHSVLAAPADAAAARAQFDAAVRALPPVVADYEIDPLGQPPVEQQLEAGRLALIHGRAQVFADPPAKAIDGAPGNRPTDAMQGLLQAFTTARVQLTIVSPYFVPSEVGMSMMRLGARHGVRTVLFTNSIASTDEPLVHAHYSRYRTEMLRLGVKIYEFNPTQTQRTRTFGSFGRSTPRLHAKVAIVDRHRLLVGSVNFDARSAIGNTEMGVVIDSPPLTEGLIRMMEGRSGANLYQLRLAADDTTIEWHGTDESGQPTVSTEEPNASAWLRFKLWLQSLFVEERLL